jgi:hypothetical protein
MLRILLISFSILLAAIITTPGTLNTTTATYLKNESNKKVDIMAKGHLETRTVISQNTYIKHV